MTYLDCIRSALTSLRSNLLRSVLTALGIIIGVGSVIAMVAVGAGAEYRVQSVIQNLGSNMLIILNGSRTSSGVRTGSGSRISLTEEDARAMQEQVDAVRVAAAYVRGSGQIIAGNVNWFTTLRGVTLEYYDARNWEVEQGRNMTESEIRTAAKVALLGETVIKELFGGQNPVGQTIRIQRVPFTVIGTLKAKGQTPTGTDQDDVVFLPLSTAKKRVLGGRRVRGNLVGAITVSAVSSDRVAEAEEDIKALLRTRHKLRPGEPDDFYTRNISSILEARAETSRVTSFLLASVAGISLLVGGIGIMNIMLVSVTERTVEIGLRMAVGAKRRDVMAQFVIEAMSLSIIGGVIGIILGFGGSIIVARYAEWPVLIGPLAVVIAVGFSAAVGIFFGYWPARVAARMDPIQALRHE